MRIKLPKVIRKPLDVVYWNRLIQLEIFVFVWCFILPVVCYYLEMKLVWRMPNVWQWFLMHG